MLSPYTQLRSRRRARRYEARRTSMWNARRLVARGAFNSRVAFRGMRFRRTLGALDNIAVQTLHNQARRIQNAWRANRQFRPSQPFERFRIPNMNRRR